MKKLLGLLLAAVAGSALAADNINVTPSGTTPVRSTDTSAGATGAGPYVNWYTLSTSGSAGTPPTVLYAPSGSSNTNAISIQGVASGTTVPVSGTVSVGTPTVNQGTSPWIVGGGATTASDGVSTSTTNAPSVAFNYIFNGATWDRVRGTGGAPNVAVTGQTGWAGGTLGAMANYGTSPGAVLVPGVNAFVTNANANGQQNMAGSSPVVLANNQSVADPCTYQLKTNLPISTATGTTLLVSGVSAKKIYICSMALVAATAVSVSLSEGTGATCSTASQAAVIGVATNGTAANGMALAANGGLTLGAGHATVASTATAANALCLFQSGTAQIAGNITYIQQ